MAITIKEVTKQHKRKAFDCGEPALNAYLQQHARQAGERNIAKTYVACQDTTPLDMLGYYSLTGYSVTIPPDHPYYQRYPHPLTAVKLVRLATDKTQQRRGIGELLLFDAIMQTTRVADQIGAIGLYVDPMTPGLMSYYESYGFLPSQPANAEQLEMWLPLATCLEVIEYT